MSGLLSLSDITLPAGPSYQEMLNFVAPTLPVTSGLVGLYMFGGSLTASLANLANPAAPLKAIGAPAIGALGATCSYANRFDTGLPETTAWTFMAIAKPIDTGSIDFLVSNYSADGISGSSLWQNAGNTIAVTVGTNASGANAFPKSSLGTQIESDYYLFAGRADAADVEVIGSHNGTLTSQGAAVTGTRYLNPARTLQVGGSWSPSYGATAQVNVLAAAIWTQKLSDADRLSTMNALRTFYAKYGVGTL